jgi:hypothetical protein
MYSAFKMIMLITGYLNDALSRVTYLCNLEKKIKN